MNFVNFFCTLFLGAVSTVAGYAGLTTALPHDGLWWKLFCALVAAGIGVAIFAFWHGAFAAATKPVQRRFRAAAWITIFIGCGFVAGISAWWHVAAIGGPAAMGAAVDQTLITAETTLARAERSRNGAQNFRARLDSLASEIGAKAVCESETGCVSGSAGKFGVYGTLVTMQGKVDGIRQSIMTQDASFDASLAEGRACLSDLRTVLSAGSESDGGIAAASKAFDCVNAVVAGIDPNGQLGRIASEMESLTSGFILPVSIKTDAQKQAVASIMEGFQTSAHLIAKDARAQATSATLEPLSLMRMSAMKAVVVHYDAILPAWITGVALDLMPLLLLSFQTTLVASRRALPDAPIDEISAADILKAQATFSALQQAAKPTLARPSPTRSSASSTTGYHISHGIDDDNSRYWEEEIDLVEENGPDDSKNDA